MGKIVDVSEAMLELGLSSSVTEEERAVVLTSITRAESAVKKHLGYNPLLAERTEFYPSRNFMQTGTAVWEADATSAYRRYMEQGATDVMLVRHIPIRSDPAIQLWIDYDARSGSKSGSFAASTLKTEGSDYWPNYDSVDSDGNSVCHDGILRSFGIWPSEPGCMKITYTAGYSLAELHGQDDSIDAGPISEAILIDAVRRAKKALFLNKKHSRIGFLTGPVTSENLGGYSYSVDASAMKDLFGSTAELSGESVGLLEDFVNYGYTLGG